MSAASADEDDSAAYLYVAERGAGAVAVFATNSVGATAPTRVVRGNATGLRDPWGVALDGHNNLYVQNFLSEATTQVFDEGARGNVAPSRALRSGYRDSPAVAVDSVGRVYAARLQVGVVEMFAPGAPAGSDPTGMLLLDGAPRSLAVDRADNLIVAVQGRNGDNAIEVFPPGASGAARPLRAVTGPSTGLGRSGNFDGPGESVVLTYGTLTGRIYAAVTSASQPTPGTTAGSTSHISVFDSQADGNVRPLRTIEGPDTKLTGATLTGVADNPIGGDIWVMAGNVGGNGVIATGELLAFSRFADGNDEPLKNITDTTTNFRDVQGIAFGTQ